MQHPRVRTHVRVTVPNSLRDLRAEINGWAAAIPPGGRPLAAVLDIDEVLLCTLLGAEPVPYDGAAELLAELRKREVLPILLTGRREWRRNATVCALLSGGVITGAEASDMLVAGNVGTPPRLIMRQCARDQLNCQGAGPYKMLARRRVAETHQILVSVGDQKSDFLPDPTSVAAEPVHEWKVPNPFYLVDISRPAR